MIPNFALGLTNDGITIWQRGRDGWLRLGAVPVDAPDLHAQMQDLSATAASLAPEGIATKLVIPDEQILYCDLEITSSTTDEQAVEIRALLDGRTPYPVNELDFDWTGSGARVRVAVVARETVIEAEEFAEEHGLNPVCAVAAPDADRFPREPFLALTRTGRRLLPDPSALRRDTQVLRETGHVTVASPELEPAPEPEPTVGHDLAPDAPQDPEPRATPPADAPEADGPAPKAAKTITGSNTHFVEVMQARLQAASAAPTSEPPDRLDDLDGATDTDTPFRSRRASTPEARRPPPSPPPSAADPAASTDLPDEGDGFAQRLRRRLGTLVGTGGAQPAVADSTDAVTRAAETVFDPPAPVAAAPAETGTRAAAPPSPRKSPIETLRSHSGASSDGWDGGASEAERLTIFGARAQSETSSGFGSRGMMILGGVGVLLLAVAVWAFYFANSQQGAIEITDAPAEMVAPEAQLPDLAESTDLSLLPDEPGDTLTTAPGDAADAAALAEIEAALGIEDAAQQLPLEPSTPETPLAEDVGSGAPAAEQPREAERAGRVAAIRSMALLPPEEIGSMPSLPSDPLPFTEELAAFESAQRAAARAARLAAGLLPPGEEDLDIAVTEGSPSEVPPARPAGLAPELEQAALDAGLDDAAPAAATEALDLAEAPETTASALAEAVAAALVPPDESTLSIPVIAGTPSEVPPARPEGLVPAGVELPSAVPAEMPETGVDPDAPTPLIEESATPDPSDQTLLDAAPSAGGLRLAALRPALRPSDLSLPEPEPEPESVPGLADASDLAVDESLRPGRRPSQFAAVVQRTLQARTSPTPSAPAPVQEARAAVSTAPRIPTQANVAREATQVRAINLRQINLIGVMGTPSSRRALVRLTNGRIVTVRVGESLDGGQITAIGDNELRYTRRGRNHVLRIAS